MEAGGEAAKKSKEKAQGFALRWKNFSKVFTEGCLPYGITSETNSTTLRSDARRIKVVLHIKKRMIRYLASIKKQKGLGSIRGKKIS